MSKVNINDTAERINDAFAAAIEQLRPLGLRSVTFAFDGDSVTVKYSGGKFMLSRPDEEVGICE